jgi:hypothetical protein
LSLFLPLVETVIRCFQCREVSYTTGESHMHLVPFAEKKGSSECIRDLVQHCWCVYDAYLVVMFCFIMLIPALPYNWHYYLFCILQGVGPSIALSFSVYESLRSFWKSQRWIYVLALNQGALYAKRYFLLGAYGFVNIYGLFIYLFLI